MSSNLKRFWLYQTLGWGSFALLNLSVRGYFSHYGVGELVNSVSLFAALMVSTGLLRLYFHRFIEDKSLGRVVAHVLLGALLAALLTTALVALVLLPNQELVFGKVIPEAPSQLLMSIPNTLFIILLWSLFYLVIKRQRLLSQREKAQEALQQSLQAAQLDLLLSQINPHFIFNAINNIRALILEDKDKARQMLTELSDVMRYVMYADSSALIPFQQELGTVKQYLSINELQFESRLSYRLDIAPDCQDVLFPKMMLQLMVENAIKHGIGKRLQGGRIDISARCEAGCLLVEVTNPGTLAPEDARGAGIGIQNIRQRLQLHYGLGNGLENGHESGLESGHENGEQAHRLAGKAAFDIRADGENVVACLRLPLDKKDREIA